MEVAQKTPREPATESKSTLPVGCITLCYEKLHIV